MTEVTLNLKELRGAGTVVRMIEASPSSRVRLVDAEIALTMKGFTLKQARDLLIKLHAENMLEGAGLFKGFQTTRFHRAA